jgi:hypothetical protein
MTLRMPPDIVVRSAGVWNSRAPFHQFLAEHKRVNRSYALTVLTALRVERDLENAEPSVRSYLNPRSGPTKISVPRQLAAWRAYKQSLGRDPATGEFRTPTVADVLSDVENVVSGVRGATLLRLVSLFESYLQCWGLNYLLDRLERGILWTNEDRILATKLSPVHSPEPEPSVAFILRCLPGVQAILRDVPPFLRHGKTGAVLQRPDPRGLNALAAVKFWIALRNLVVHRSGWVSVRFATKHAEMWSLLLGDRPHIPRLNAGSEVLLFHELVDRAGANLYLAALALSDELEARSEGRRGHPWAPSPRPKSEPKQMPPRPKQLLVEGDHDLSFRWATDKAFRDDFAASNLP